MNQSKYISVQSRVFHFPKKVLQISGFQLHKLHTTQTTHITQMIMVHLLNYVVNMLNHMVNWLNYMVNLINTMVT